MRGDKKLAENIDRLQLSGIAFSITPITLCELYRGAYGHHNADEKIRDVNAFIAHFKLLEFTALACHEFGKMYIMLETAGKMVSEFDLMIASLVKSHELILITRDRKDFEKTGVKMEVW